MIASWGGNANYAGDLFVYGDLITANDRLDGQAVLSVVVGNENITPGFSTSSTNSTNYYLGSKSPCMGSGEVPQDLDEDGEPDTTTDEEGNTVPIMLPTDDYIQMKVSTAKQSLRCNFAPYFQSLPLGRPVCAAVKSEFEGLFD